MVRALLALVLLCHPSTAHAWGELGHRIVCEVAYAQLTPTAKAEVDRLMALDEEFETFGKSCSWADAQRPRRAEEHYVNVPRDHWQFFENECPEAEKCVISAIKDDTSILRSPVATDSEKLAALKFLGHWVGDIHQPLHVSFADDRGGNHVNVSGACNGNLHSAWDTCLVELGVADTMKAAGLQPSDLEGFIALLAESTLDVPPGEPWQWANGSYQMLVLRTEYCDAQPGPVCLYDGPSENREYDEGEPVRIVVFDEEYLSKNQRIPITMILTAGLNLRILLNDIFPEPN